MTIAEVFRDAPAGQIVRYLLDWKITPYEDEREGFIVHQTLSRQNVVNVSKPEFLRNMVNDTNPDSGVNKVLSDDGIATAAGSHGEEAMLGKSEEVASLKAHGLEPSAEEVNLVEFMSTGDRDNPLEWSLARRIWHFSLVCLLTFAVYSASAIITPAEVDYIFIFHVDLQQASLVLSMYVVGYGLGPLLFSPLSEIPQLGRNAAYISSLFMFLVFTAIASGVSNYPGLVVLRLLQGFFGGPVLATGAASILDIFPFHKVPYALAAWAFVGYAGPALGPAMSAFAIRNSTWRWTLWESLILGAVTLALMFCFMPETNADYILGLRAMRLRKRYGNSTIQSRAEVAAASRPDWFASVQYHLYMPFKITILDPSIFFLNIYCGLAYGIYYSYFESFPIVYLDIYGFTFRQMSLVFICIIVGGGVALAVFVILVYFIYEPYSVKYGIGKPESRLVPGIFGAILAPSGMFLYGFTAKASISWVVPTLGIAMFAGFSFILLNVIIIYLPISYPRYAASVFAANGVFRSAMACAAIHVSQPLFYNLGVGNGSAVLGGLAGFCAILFIGLYMAGPALRARSKFAETY